ncbi:MAG: efflux RND transporter periplasmic adaptor subunit [Casimicrobium sp.]|jgi:RND family efflux transporter MFP subunit
MTSSNASRIQITALNQRWPIVVAMLASSALIIGTLPNAKAATTTAPELATMQVQAASGNSTTAFDGVVEAVRQTVIAAQVAGAITHLEAKVGDRVKAGQVLLRIDARAADQNVAASDAQVQAARASLDVAAKDFERQKQLSQKGYISPAALERAESQFKSTKAQVNSLLAQAGVARTQTGFNIVRAPYAGVIAEVPVTLGDMAMPGRALMTIYDPAALRVTGSVPQTALGQTPSNVAAKAEIPGLAGPSTMLTPTQVQVLPTVDASTHTMQLRLDLPSGIAGVTPGMFARLWIPTTSGAAGRSTVPSSAVIRRAEMTGLYVLDTNGRPLLRQVRLGRTSGDSVEILSGIMPGERIALDPQAAARIR